MSDSYVMVNVILTDLEILLLDLLSIPNEMCVAVCYSHVVVRSYPRATAKANVYPSRTVSVSVSNGLTPNYGEYFKLSIVATSPP